MTNDFDARIQEQRATLERVKEEMAGIQASFLSAATRWATSWYQKEAASTIEREHAVTCALTDEQLKAMKVEVLRLNENAREAIDVTLGLSKLWWHVQDPLPIGASQGAESQWRYSLYGHRRPDHISNALRLAAGRLGAVLEKYGYLRTRENGRDRAEWRDRGGSGEVIYPYSLEWSTEMDQVMAQYATKQVEAMKVLDAIAKITEEKRRAEAKDRWNSA